MKSITPEIKQIIAVDADDTIFDENGEVMQFHNRTYGTKHTLADYLEPSEYGSAWEKIWGTDTVETLQRYEQYIAYKLEHNVPPLAGALPVLQWLKKTYDLVIVTSRDARSVKMTHDALHEHYRDIFSDVHFVPLWGGSERATKAQICNEIGAAYLIDDSYEHCLLAAESDVEALLFGHYGWNRAKELVPHMTRVKDWGAVRDYFGAK